MSCCCIACSSACMQPRTSMSVIARRACDLFLVLLARRVAAICPGSADGETKVRPPCLEGFHLILKMAVSGSSVIKSSKVPCHVSGGASLVNSMRPASRKSIPLHNGHAVAITPGWWDIAPIAVGSEDLVGHEALRGNAVRCGAERTPTSVPAGLPEVARAQWEKDGDELRRGFFLR